MKSSTTQTVMKCVGATLAVCSAISMLEGSKMMNSGTNMKKMVKKTVNKAYDIVDAISTLM